MIRKLLPTLALLIAATVVAVAQETSGARKVKRITFDRELVNIEYTDGTSDKGVSAATVKRTETTTGIKAVKPSARQKANQWYTIDGRSLQGAPRQKGVYIVRDNKGIKKTIKK